MNTYEIWRSNALPNETYREFVHRHRQLFYNPDLDTFPDLHELCLDKRGIIAWTGTEIWAWIVMKQNNRGFWGWFKQRYEPAPKPGATRPSPAHHLRTAQ